MCESELELKKKQHCGQILCVPLTLACKKADMYRTGAISRKDERSKLHYAHSFEGA